MTPATEALNWQLLRLMKGAVKAYETWLRAETGGGNVVQFIPRTIPLTTSQDNTPTQAA